MKVIPALLYILRRGVTAALSSCCRRKRVSSVHDQITYVQFFTSNIYFEWMYLELGSWREKKYTRVNDIKIPTHILTKRRNQKTADYVEAKKILTER